MTIRAVTPNSRSSAIRMSKPRLIIEQDFLRLGFQIERKHAKRLSKYPGDVYEALFSNIQEAYATFKFDQIIVESYKRVRGADFSQITPEFLVLCVEGEKLDLTDLGYKLYEFQKRARIEVADPKMPGVVEYDPIEIHRKPRSSSDILLDGEDPLTEDLLLNPSALNPDHPYPTSFEEYEKLMSRITGSFGVFPDDEMPFPNIAYFRSSALRKQGVEVYPLNRGGYDLNAVFFNPKMIARQFRNLLIFMADLVSQSATYADRGIIGCTYDRQSYYVDRLFNAEKVAFVFLENMPVAFSSIDLFETIIDGQATTFPFIHFGMAAQGFQRLRLVSFIGSKMLFSMFWHKVYSDIGNVILGKDSENLFVDERGKIVSKFGKVWVGGHTGRAPAAHIILKHAVTSGNLIKQSARVIEAMGDTADLNITGDRGNRPPLKLVTPYGLCDPEIYPEENRYPMDDDGNVIFSSQEKKLSTFPMFLDVVGGEEGLKNGNGGYFFGYGDLSTILQYKSYDRKKLGGGIVERSGHKALGKIVSQVI